MREKCGRYVGISQNFPYNIDNNANEIIESIKSKFNLIELFNSYSFMQK